MKTMPWLEWAVTFFLFSLLVVLAALYVISILPDVGPARLAACQNSLKTMGLVFKMYSGESAGMRLPSMMATSAGLVDCDDNYREVAKGGFVASAPLLGSIYPEYAVDLNIMFCPSSPGSKFPRWNNPKTNEEENLKPCVQPLRGMRLGSLHYTYLGWAFDKADCDTAYRAGIVEGPRQMVEVLAPLTRPWRGTEPATAADVAKIDADITVPAGFGNLGGDKVYRLHEGVERFLITDVNNPAASAEAQSKIAVMWDAVSMDKGSGKFETNHIPGGSNVLFLDGHVEFIKLTPCEGAPVNEAVARTLATAFPAP